MFRSLTALFPQLHQKKSGKKPFSSRIWVPFQWDFGHKKKPESAVFTTLSGFAGDEGVEPSSTVLETDVKPFN